MPVMVDEWYYADWTQEFVQDPGVRLQPILNSPSLAQALYRIHRLPFLLAMAAPYKLAQAVEGLGVVHAMGLTNIFATALAGMFVFLSGLALGYRTKTSLFTSFVFALGTPAWFYSKTYVREPFAGMWLIGGFYFLVLFRKKSSFWALAASLLFFLLAMLTRSSLAVFLPFVALYIFFVIAAHFKKTLGSAKSARSRYIIGALIAVLVLFFVVSGYFFFFGVGIAIYGLFTLLILPAFKALLRFFSLPAVMERQGRILSAACIGVSLLVFFLFWFPMPMWSTTQGIIWLPEQSIVRAGADSEIQQVLVSEGSIVTAGTPLVKGDDPFLSAEIAADRALLEELYATWRGLSMFDRVKRKIVQDRIQVVKEELQRLQEQKRNLVIRSPADGKFMLADARRLPGLFVKRGQIIGYVVAEHAPLIRAAVTQEHIGLLRRNVTGVEVKFSEHMAETFEASIKRMVPEADVELPSAALGSAGGGLIPVDPADPEGRHALTTFFQLDISVPHQISDPHIGERVYVRFDYGTMPVGMQWYRSLRQLFLKRFHV